LSVQADESIAEVTNKPESRDAFAKLKDSLEKYIDGAIHTGSKYPEITFLGTGSSIPSKIRNVSGILVRLRQDQWVILDCGEGTYGQIYRFYGRSQTAEILKNLKAIFISHLHADHHMGLLQILAEREKVFNNTTENPLFLLAPVQINNWLKQYHTEFSPILHLFKLIPNSYINYIQTSLENGKYDALINELDLREIGSVEVRHCKNAFGIVLTHNDGWKLVYSGDTMPCEALVEAGKNCDVLIHEATMEDELVDDAKSKNHSTTSQAIEAGRKMNAKFTILTHFSQRYAKVPLFTDAFHGTVGVAFDNMKVSMKNLQLIPLFTDVLKEVFSEDYEDMQIQRERKQFRKELLAEMDKEKTL